MGEGNSESPYHATNTAASSPATTYDNNNPSVDQPASPAGPPLQFYQGLLQGLQVKVYKSVLKEKMASILQHVLENYTQIPLDGFMIQFNKNTFGLAAGGPLQVAVKNSQQPVWYFSDKISLLVFFARMEEWRSFLETWKSLPDSNEISKDFPAIVVDSVEATLDRLAASNMFFIARRKHINQEVLYLSAKIPRGVPFLIELTAAIGVPGLKCAVKSPNTDLAPLFFEAIETLLKSH
ncbi:UNVERIFIED_CONTAM: Beta-adaptin-like protein C [Sesamum latifolium]|uniref:Beta-adaptin-like protein C n=1 Tax=Sesamum latifolium TaxID=2727402 RepID=A0AAW2SNB2_9LAMI